VSTDANLSPQERSAYAAIQIGAYIGIPLVKGGEFVAGLAIHTSEPRVWTPDEVALAEEVAERTWAAVDRARAEAVVAADLEDTQLLRELGARLVTEGDIQTLYQEIMSLRSLSQRRCRNSANPRRSDTRFGAARHAGH
jgi:GAF domain-containing protein